MNLYIIYIYIYIFLIRVVDRSCSVNSNRYICIYICIHRYISYAYIQHVCYMICYTIVMNCYTLYPAQKKILNKSDFSLSGNCIYNTYVFSKSVSAVV